jgi:hypothetical protein
MISLKQFISEVYSITVPKKEGGRTPLLTGLGKNIDTVKSSHLSDIDPEHSLHVKEAGHKKTYYVVANKKIVSSIETKKNGKSEQVNLTAAHHTNTMPVHRVYAHLIKKHDTILQSSDHQSAGGKGVWHRLSKEPGIAVHGWNPESKTAVNLGNKLSSDTDHDTHVNSDDDYKDARADSHHEINRVGAMTLIAHKK